MVLKRSYNCPASVRTEEERALYREACLRKAVEEKEAWLARMHTTPEGRAELVRMDRQLHEAEEELVRAGLI